ncbi:CAP domain-containing protein [Mediterraneibacter butyricigenes]|uniref:CAP domain-containing protein n=1 Tax=Mediterraneibacter butyricigenes TaxID=2316025 RepID=UPI000E65E31A
MDGLFDEENIRAYEITNTYSHTRPNGEWALSSWRYVSGENLARGQKSAEQVCNDWFASPGHNQNILSNNYSSIGIGVFCKKVDNGYVYHFSQMFSATEY